MEIKKKSGLSINPDIHHSKVPSSADLFNLYLISVNMSKLKKPNRTGNQKPENFPRNQ